HHYCEGVSHLLQPHVWNRHSVADSSRSELFALQQSTENNVVLDVQHDSCPVSEVVHQCPLVTHGEVNDGVHNPADRLNVYFSPSCLLPLSPSTKPRLLRRM